MRRLITPSRSRKTARVVDIFSLGKRSRGWNASGGSDQAAVPEKVIPLLALDVGKSSVTGNHVEDNFAAFEFEAEVELAQTRATHGITQAMLVFLAIQHQEAATSRSTNLAANRAVVLGQFVPGVDLRAADGAR